MFCNSVESCRRWLLEIIETHLGGAIVFDRVDHDFVEIGAYALPGIRGGDVKAEARAIVSFTVRFAVRRFDVGAAIVWNPITQSRVEARTVHVGFVSSSPLVSFSFPEDEGAIIRAIDVALHQARRASRAMVVLRVGP